MYAGSNGRADRRVVSSGRDKRRSALPGQGSVKVAVDDGQGNMIGYEVQTERKQLTFVASVDASYSMHGERADAATRGLGKIVEMMKSTDRYGLFTFSREVKNLHHAGRRAKFNFAKDVQNVLANTARGGCTALWDAVLSGLAELKETNSRFPKERAVFEHVVITDGCDNASSANFADVQAAVARPGLPNYHLVVVAVAMPAAQTAQMRELCKLPHATFVDVAAVDELERGLSKVAEQIKQTLVIKRANGHAQRAVAHSGRGGAATAAAKLDANSGGAISALVGSLGAGLNALALGGTGGALASGVRGLSLPAPAPKGSGSGFFGELRKLVAGTAGIDAANLKREYRVRFGKDIVVKPGEKLKDLLRKAEAAGAIQLEHRGLVLWVLPS